MLPSRGPIQVTLDDTGSRVHCTKVPTQVKILSRPRVNNNSTPTSNNYINNSNGNIRGNFNNLDNKAPPAHSAAKSDSSPYSLLLNSAQKARQNNGQPPNPSCPSRSQDSNNSNASTASTSGSSGSSSCQNHEAINERHQNNNLSDRSALGFRFNGSSMNNNDNSTNQGTSSKKILKTYQERADEYAKARLRILGSAFPEDDDSLAKSDDVNRILNPDLL